MADMYTVVTTEDELSDALDTIEQSGAAALDFETTGLWLPAEVRLAQICNDDVWIVIDFWALPGKSFEAYAHWFADARVKWIAFNGLFEYSWFGWLDLYDVHITDVAHLRRSVMGGDQMSFAQMLQRDFEYSMPKGEQKSNWAAPELADSQIAYAADDALWTWKAYVHWHKRATEMGTLDAAKMFDDLIPCCFEMRETGLALDDRRHRELVKGWKKRAAIFEAGLRSYVGEDEVHNLASRTQWSDFLNQVLPDNVLSAWPRTKNTGQLQMTTASAKEMAIALGGDRENNPVVDVLYHHADMTTVNQYLSNFGDKLLDMAGREDSGRIHPSYNIARAVTGRFSSSAPNVQQIPRDRVLLGEDTSVRRSFVAGPGREYATFDYSGIELRTLALLSGDDQLLYDCIDGDLHSEVASFMVGRKIDKSLPADKEIRSRAKGVSFGIIYGSTAVGVASTLRTSISRAQELVDFWADRYPKAFNLRSDVMDEALANDGYIRMVDGGTIYMGKKPSMPKCANYPVQRAALTIMARALIRHRASLNDQAARYNDWADVSMAATIHDAMIDEAPRRLAPEVLQVMAYDMQQGFLDVFPGASTDKLLEGGHGKNWGDIKDSVVL